MGLGWVYSVDGAGRVIWENRSPKLVRCACQRQSQREREQRILLTMDGLKASERLLRFEDLMLTKNQSALDHVRESVDRRRGLITLIGKPGSGKTSLLICAVNQARDLGRSAVYTTVTDLLAYLRQAFDPKSDHAKETLGLDVRWRTLVDAELLALDELDEFNTTAWAMEQFLRLIDERWRQIDRVLTLCATNSGLRQLPEKVTSRLLDGRAQVLQLGNLDMRGYQQWRVEGDE